MQIEMLFTGLWRQSLGIESVLLLAATLYAVVSVPPTWPLAILLTLAWCAVFVGWIKYWRMETLLRVPQMMILL